MATLNISQAARAANVTRATIHKHIRTSKLSASIEGDGKKVIDVAELERVYGSLVTPDTLYTNDKSLHSDTGGVTAVLQGHIEWLEREIDLIRKERDEEKGVRERERDEHRQERARLHGIIEKQTLLLTAPKEEPVPAPAIPQKPPSLWGWLTGRQ